MATTNLISKSLGDVLTESGNGTPDHTSPLGSLYTDKDTGSVWRNLDGSTSWEKLNTVAYGYVYFNGNTTTTTISSSPTAWFPVSNTSQPFTLGDSIGFSASTSTMTLLNGYDGDYEIRADVTIDYTTADGNYEIGINVGDTLVPAAYNGAWVDGTAIRAHIGIQCITSLSGGTTIALDARNLTSATNLDVTDAQIFARKL